MEELKQLLKEDKEMLKKVDDDLIEMRSSFITFFNKMEGFMGSMQKFIDKKTDS